MNELGPMQSRIVRLIQEKREVTIRLLVEHGIPDEAARYYCHKLVKKRILVRVSRGKYMINKNLLVK